MRGRSNLLDQIMRGRSNFRSNFDIKKAVEATDDLAACETLGAAGAPIALRLQLSLW